MEPDAPTTIEVPTVLEPGGIAAKVQIDAQAKYRSDLVSFGWWSIAQGSILAAGAYPLLLLAVGLSVQCVKGVTFGFAVSKFTAVDWLWMCLYQIVFSFGCLLWVGAIAAVTLPILHFIIRSLELRVSLTYLGAFTGGLLILLATLPISLDWPRMQRNSGSWEVARVLTMGVALATIVGQIGGAYGGLRAARRTQRQQKVRQQLLELGWRQPALNDLSPEVNGRTANSNHRFQFRTVHLLWVAAWISLLLTAIRLVGLRFETVLPFIFGWLIYQSLTLWLGGIIVRRLAPWWARRRQGRST
jgi:hypothetical protein